LLLVKAALLRTAPLIIIAMLAIIKQYAYFFQFGGRIFSSRYCFSVMQPAMTAVNFAYFMALLLGSGVKFSFTTFFAIQPMLVVKPVRVFSQTCRQTWFL